MRRPRPEKIFKPDPPTDPKAFRYSRAEQRSISKALRAASFHLARYEDMLENIEREHKIRIDVDEDVVANISTFFNTPAGWCDPVDLEYCWQWFKTSSEVTKNG